MGVRTIKLTPERGKVVGAKVVREDHELMLVSIEGIVIRVPVNGISRFGRISQGVRVMGMKGEDRVSALARVVSTKTSTKRGTIALKSEEGLAEEEEVAGEDETGIEIEELEDLAEPEEPKGP
jgi:DNA gyrase subunit A